MGAAAPAESRAVTAVVVPREKYRLAEQTVDRLLAEPDLVARVIYVDEARSPRRLRRRIATRAQGEPRLDHLALPRPAGANECRSLGFELARTPYVLFIDNDAHLGPGSVRALVDCADDTGASFVAPVYLYRDGTIHHAGDAAAIVDVDGRRRLVEDHPLHGRQYVDVLPTLTRVPTTAPELHGVLVRADSLVTAGGFDVGLRSAMDCLDLGLRLAPIDGGGWQEPNAVVVYDDSPPRLSDLPLHAGRWARATVAADVARFASSWDLDPGDPRLAEHAAFLAGRRRAPVRYLRGAVRRLVGEPARDRLDEALDGLVDRATAGSRRTR